MTNGECISRQALGIAGAAIRHRNLGIVMWAISRRNLGCHAERSEAPAFLKGKAGPSLGPVLYFRPWFRMTRGELTPENQLTTDH
jgi:hypothetical protein